MTFTPRSALVWSLGPFDAPEIQLNGVDDFGVEWIVEDPEGWKTVTPEVPAEALPGDGARPGPGRFTERVIQLRGAFRAGCMADLDAAEDRWRAAVERVTSDQVLAVTEPIPKQVAFRLSGQSRVDYATRRMRTFTAMVTAYDPLKYAAGAAGRVTRTLSLWNPATAGGVVFPLAFPMTFTGGTSDPSYSTIVNPGTAARFPELVFSGPVTGGRVVHDGKQQFYGVSGALAAGVTAAANLRTRALLVDGQSRQSRRYPGSVPWTLDRGSNEVRFVADSYNADARAQLTYTPAWR